LGPEISSVGDDLADWEIKKLRQTKVAVQKPSRMRSPFRFSSNRLELLTFLGDEKRLVS
jgi:hypothetical protein